MSDKTEDAPKMDAPEVPVSDVAEPSDAAHELGSYAAEMPDKPAPKKAAATKKAATHKKKDEDD